MIPLTAVPQQDPFAHEVPSLGAFSDPASVFVPAHAPVASGAREYVPAPVPAPSRVNTPVYDEMVAEWSAFGRYWPGADDHAVAGLFGHGPYPAAPFGSWEGGR
ncbi:hypothetical protein ACFYM0_02685 [Streptomyces sp. NPDC006487]|uniref:hypothetical protein n=1 Tax=Streptomyces sp. NPDC006487 TaxID=3364748 RepID=UPI00367E54D9